ncbi:hypothetical protein H311_03192 [Anncaliia algerae PRA109]|nr:hypothetical protein H311_03192 [Anncaliia algerae PRA109]
MREKPEKSIYLNKSYDYTKLTKDQIREILFDNNIPDIPQANNKKEVFLEFYKINIYDKIDELKKQVIPSDEGIEYEGKNILQSNLNEDEKTIISTEEEGKHDRDNIFAKNSASPKKSSAISNKSVSSPKKSSAIPNEDKKQRLRSVKIDSSLAKKNEQKMKNIFISPPNKTSVSNDSLFLTTKKKSINEFTPENIERVNFKSYFTMISFTSLFLFNLFYNGPFFNFIIEFFLFFFILILQIYYFKKEIKCINAKLKHESERIYEGVIDKIRESALKGKSVNVAVVKKRFTNDDRVWNRVKKLINCNKKISMRKGTFEGRRVDVWEYKL